MLKRITRSILALALALTCVLPLGQNAFAHDNQTLHEKDLESVFFDNDIPSNQDAVRALKSAVYLCIDYHNGSENLKEKYLKELLDYSGPKFKATIKLKSSNIEMSGSSYHRRYTHYGWNTQSAHIEEMGNLKPAEKEKLGKSWKNRKNILLETTRALFKPNLKDRLPWKNDKGQCTDKQIDSFSALVYYTHIAGDYCSDYKDEYDKDSGKKHRQPNGEGWGEMIPFALPNATEKNPDIFTELQKHLGVLFEGKRTYSRLKVDLNTLAKRARNDLGGLEINSKEEFDLTKQYANELMALLEGGKGCTGSREYEYENQIHILLMNEGFFRNAFYGEG